MLGSLIFQATTISLPKVFDERLTSMASTTTGIGILAAVVFSVAAFAQILVGWLIDRKSLRTVFCVIAGLQAPLYLVAVSLTGAPLFRSEEHTSELQSLMRNSYAGFCLKNK